jgi:hypothetical protein
VSLTEAMCGAEVSLPYRHYVATAKEIGANGHDTRWSPVATFVRIHRYIVQRGVTPGQGRYLIWVLQVAGSNPAAPTNFRSHITRIGLA